jgi:hypothetical protein
MSTCDTFFHRFHSEMDDPAAIGPEERWLSTAAGGLLVAFGLSQLRLMPLAALGAGAFLVYRGGSGRCPLRARLAQRGWQRESAAPWEGPRAEEAPNAGPWERGEAQPAGEKAPTTPATGGELPQRVDGVDEAVMESFPASDAPSYTGTTVSPSPRIE